MRTISISLALILGACAFNKLPEQGYIDTSSRDTANGNSSNGPSSEPGSEASSEPGSEPGSEASSEPGSEPGSEASSEPGSEPTPNDTDGNGVEDVCEENHQQASVQANCWTDTLSCGDVFEGTLARGSIAFDIDDYLADPRYCMPATASKASASYDGPSRVFLFEAPEDIEATITLESPCDDTDMFAWLWNPEVDGCPTEESYIQNNNVECSYNSGSQDDVIGIFETYPNKIWMIIIESADGSDADFRLSVTCP